MKEIDEQTRKQREATVIEQHEGIYPMYEAFYLESIIYAADRCEDAFRRFDAGLAASATAAVIVATVQEGLTHAAALSRYFWPMKKDSLLASARGERLRKAFDLGDGSPLKSRKLRNAFEHFDEDLDRFLLNDLTGYFFPGPMIGSHELDDDDLGNFFRLVDPLQGICVLLGEKFEFRPIRSEVQRILTRALEMNSQGSRL
jgi:hypothetical protein